MITGAHVILYSKDAEADRTFFRDVLGFPHVDAGRGWLIFALPPSEMAVHPEGEESHELFLMCDALGETMAMLHERGVACEPPVTSPWGIVTKISLPGGGKLGLYEPKHPIAAGMTGK
jgi:catechol 2,3-dioxygenase-like lactoylglutathione lyase family enzyme